MNTLALAGLRVVKPFALVFCAALEDSLGSDFPLAELLFKCIIIIDELPELLAHRLTGLDFKGTYLNVYIFVVLSHSIVISWIINFETKSLDSAPRHNSATESLELDYEFDMLC